MRNIEQISTWEVFSSIMSLKGALYLDLQIRHDMRFPTMWYVRPTKAQTSLRIRAD